MSKKRAIALALVVIVLAAGAGYVAIVRPAWLPFGLARQQPDPLAVFIIEQNDNKVHMEAGVEGHRDLRFENQSDREFTVALEMTDCDCVGVKMCLLPSNATEAEPAARGKSERASSYEWQTLELRRKRITVPPHDRGIIRLTWKSKTPTEHTFWAGLVLDNGEARGLRRVEVKVQQIEIVRLRAADDPQNRNIDVGLLKRGEKRTAHFLAFSETRDHFTLTPVEDTSEPCVSYAKPKPLTKEELRRLSEKTGINVLSGYRADVMIHESAGKAQLDIGPFRRKAAWNTDVLPGGLQESAMVDGNVLGDIGLKDSENKRFVDLGTVEPSDPKPVEFTLESRDPGVELILDEDKTLSMLDVEMLDGAKGKESGSGKNWRIRVQFRSSSFFRGVFPNPERPEYDNAVICSVVFLIKRAQAAEKTTASSPRRLYVPVRGTVKSF